MYIYKQEGVPSVGFDRQGVDREGLEKHAKSEQMERNGGGWPFSEVVGIVMQTNDIEGINRKTDNGCPGGMDG